MGRDPDAVVGSNTIRRHLPAVPYQAGISVGRDLWANRGDWVPRPLPIVAFNLDATVVVSLLHPCERDWAQKAVVVMHDQ
jgi:hypothetical protein